MRVSVRLSVSNGPTTLTRTTTSQYGPGTYRPRRNCTINASTNAAENTSVVFVSPKPMVSLT